MIVSLPYGCRQPSPAQPPPPEMGSGGLILDALGAFHGRTRSRVRFIIFCRATCPHIRLGPWMVFSWGGLERIGVPMAVRIPLHMTINETGIAAVLVVPLWSIIEKATGLIRSEIGFVETGLYARFGD